MLTQTIEINLTQSKLSSIIMRSEEKGREIAFSVIDEAGDPVALEDYSVKFLMLKPDDNVIYADVVSGVLTQTEQMTTSKGAGYYCIRIIDAGTVIYSGQGRVLIDDHVIDDETLDSISEVDGLIFPDDFASKAWVEEYVDEHTGSDVIANPDTPPTDTLETVTIEDTTYDIIHPAEDVSGNPIEITYAAAAPMIKCVSSITGYQNGTGTPSPDNIRPIVAYTEGEIEVGGFNRWDEEWEEGTLNPQGGTQDNNVDLRSKNFCKVDSGATYCFSIVTALTGMIRYVFWYDADKNFISYHKFTTPTTVAPNNAKYFKLVVQSYIRILTTYRNNICFNISDTSRDGTYEPYTSTTHTTTYPSAIYRGSEDVVNGEVTNYMPVIDLGDLAWVKNTTIEIDRYYATIPGMKSASAYTVANIISSSFGTVSLSDMNNNLLKDVIAGYTTQVYISTERGKYATETDFKTAMSGVQVAYELDTPTTTPVTPTNLPIRTLNGYNHIESSTGALDITYIKQPYEPIIRSAEQADNNLIRITAAYDAASLSNTDVSINYRDYDALVIYVNDVLTQCGVSSLYTREYLDYCRANNRTLTFFPFGTAYISYNILTDKLEYAGDNNQGFYIIRIDGINYRR